MTGFNFDQNRMSLNETKKVTDCSTNNNKRNSHFGSTAVYEIRRLVSIESVRLI